MDRTTSPLRRAGLTVALAATAASAGVALAPAASASTALAGPSYVAPATGAGGPVAFLVTTTGRVPVFYCSAGNENMLHNVCQADPTTGGDRY